MRVSKQFMHVAIGCVVAISTLVFLSGCSTVLDGGPPLNPAVKPMGDNRAFILTEPMPYEVGSTGIVIEVPAGFVTDYASIPKPLWSVYSPHDQYSRAAVVHDYLYWSQLCTREQADNLLMIAMKESDVSEITRDQVYRAVRYFGESSWNANAQQRIAKMPRVVPIDQIRNFPPNWSWERYRAYLMDHLVSDPVFIGNTYCALGNSTDVPSGSKHKSAAVDNSLPVNTIIRDLTD